MAIRFNTARRNSLADAGVLDLTVLEIRTGGQPASANDAASGTLLATITGITWGAATAGVKTVTGTPNVTAAATGTAGWGRFRNTGDTMRMDGVAGAEFTLADPNIVSGGTVTLTSASYTQPSGE
jgi:hypothetical protein